MEQYLPLVTLLILAILFATISVEPLRATRTGPAAGSIVSGPPARPRSRRTRSAERYSSSVDDGSPSLTSGERLARAA